MTNNKIYIVIENETDYFTPAILGEAFTSHEAARRRALETLKENYENVPCVETKEDMDNQNLSEAIVEEELVYYVGDTPVMKYVVDFITSVNGLPVEDLNISAPNGLSIEDVKPDYEKDEED